MKKSSVLVVWACLGWSPLLAADELQLLREQLALQQKQIEQLRAALEEQKRLLDRLAPPASAQQNVVKVEEAARKTNVSVPVVVRLEGTNAKEARAILADSGLNFAVAGSFQEAANLVTQAIR